MKVASLLILLSLIFSGCGKATSDIVSELRALPDSPLPEGSSTSANLIDGAEQTVTLIYDSSEVSNPTSCSVSDPVGLSIATPCSCTAGECTVGLTPSGVGSASFSYTVRDSTTSDTGSADLTVKNIVPFVSTWRVSSPDLTVELPLRSGFNYDFTVDWGDGNTAEVTSYNDPDIDHTYAVAGDYTVTISGLVEAWYFNFSGDREKIISISELGTVGWKSFENAFDGCDNLTTVSGGDTSNVTNMSAMFYEASLATPHTANWDTSNVTDMSEMFRRADNATPDTSNRDTSSVTDMTEMFKDAYDANPDTTNWDTSNVTSMREMFDHANVAQPNTINWDTSNVTDMSGMFRDAFAANPNTSNWDTSSVTNMNEMFKDATNADPDMSDWEFTNVILMVGMFEGVSISTTNYDNLLIQLDATAGSGGFLHAGSSQYTSGGAAATARANLISDSWTINDGGSI